MPITDEEFAALVKKVDSLSTPPVDPIPKEDARDILLNRGAEFLRDYLKDNLPKEKLDSYSFNDLLVAAELKSHFKPSVLNPAPPITKTDAKPDSRPSWLIPTIEGM